jgi:hypothetical protein
MYENEGLASGPPAILGRTARPFQLCELKSGDGREAVMPLLDRRRRGHVQPFGDLLLFGLVTSECSCGWKDVLFAMGYLAAPVIGIQACAGFVVLVVNWINRRDDPRYAKQPPNPS